MALLLNDTVVQEIRDVQEIPGKEIKKLKITC